MENRRPLTSSQRVARALKRASTMYDSPSSRTLEVDGSKAAQPVHTAQHAQHAPQATQQAVQRPHQEIQQPVARQAERPHLPAGAGPASPVEVPRDPPHLPPQPKELPLTPPFEPVELEHGSQNGYQAPHLQHAFSAAAGHPPPPPSESPDSFSSFPSASSAHELYLRKSSQRQQAASNEHSLTSPATDGSHAAPYPPSPSHSPPVPQPARRMSANDALSIATTPPPLPRESISSEEEPSRSYAAVHQELFSKTELYPGFDRDGDVLIQCTEDGRNTGFRVNALPLSRVSGTFASAIAHHPINGVRAITVTETPNEMSILLHAIIYGVSHPRSVALNVDDFLTLLDMYDKYAITPVLREILVHEISKRAAELARPLSVPGTSRLVITAYLTLAHTCRSERLWEAALLYANRWQEAVRPWNSARNDDLSVEVFDILLALEGVKGKGEGYSMLKVVYKDGRAGVARSKEGRVFMM